MDPENQSLNETLTIYSLLSLLFFLIWKFWSKDPCWKFDAIRGPDDARCKWRATNVIALDGSGKKKIYFIVIIRRCLSRFGNDNPHKMSPYKYKPHVARPIMTFTFVKAKQARENGAERWSFEQLYIWFYIYFIRLVMSLWKSKF